MCRKECIFYTCGHTSTSVLRPCPLTTESFDFAVCNPLVESESLAEHMCPGCARIIQGRWYIIKDRQHRWLHERGACGCTIFVSPIPTAVGPVGGGVSLSPYTTFGTLSPQQGYAQGSPSEQQAQNSFAPVPPYRQHFRHDYIRFPTSEQQPQNSYSQVPTREQRVLENSIPYLYAVSWTQEHRVRHVAGQCSCHVDFTPVAQTIFREDVDKTLHDIRRREKGIREQYRQGELSVQDAARALEALSVGEHRAMQTRARRASSSTPLASFNRRSNGTTRTLFNPYAPVPNARAPHNVAPRPARPDASPAQVPRAVRNQATAPVQSRGRTVYMTPRVAAGTQHASGHTPGSVPPPLQRAPVCGFPIGAGPESTCQSHIPPWESCALARWGTRPASR